MDTLVLLVQLGLDLFSQGTVSGEPRSPIMKLRSGSWGELGVAKMFVTRPENSTTVCVACGTIQRCRQEKSGWVTNERCSEAVRVATSLAWAERGFQLRSQAIPVQD